MTEKNKNKVLTQKMKSDSLLEKLRRRVTDLRYGELTVKLKVHDGLIKEMRVVHGEESWRAD